MLGAARVHRGDVLVGLASTGLHTNGYSLARRIVNERMRLGPAAPFPGEGGDSVAGVLLRVHRSYLAALRPVLPRLRALAHITGGGIPGNLHRVLPPALDAVVDASTWQVPNVFRRLGEAGDVDRDEMFRAFNMGVGMIALVSPDDVNATCSSAAAAGVHAWPLGEIVDGTGAVQLTGGSE
jgi:phosphoribosylformylglycinamidine cyclo-ligase